MQMWLIYAQMTMIIKGAYCLLPKHISDFLCDAAI